MIEPYFEQFVKDPNICKRSDLQKIGIALKEGLISRENAKRLFDGLGAIANKQIPRWQQRFRNLKDAFDSGFFDHQFGEKKIRTELRT